jgi:hypothetical protein
MPTPYKTVRSLSLTEAAYVAGLVDGEGTITLSRKHADEQRQLAVTISSTEPSILEFVMSAVGAGKITRKAPARSNHAVGLTFALWNRQALSLLTQVTPFLCSYKRQRAELVLRDYLRVTPRNGKYSELTKRQKREFEATLMAIRANGGLGRRPSELSH